MTVFLITLGLIIGLGTIVIGYLVPYIVLGFYAIKRKTTIKSSISLLNEYDSLFDVFSISHIEGLGCGTFVVIISVAQVLNHSVSYNDMMVEFSIIPIVVFCALLFIIGSLAKLGFGSIDGKLREQSIKI